MENTGRRRLFQVAAGVTCAIAANGFLIGSESQGVTKHYKYYKGEEYLEDPDQMSDEESLESINQTIGSQNSKNHVKPGPYPVMKNPDKRHYYFTHYYGPDQKNQFGRLHLPAGKKGPIPIIVFIHGGGWQNTLSLDYCDVLCDDLASLGIGVWNIEYRRVFGGGGWPRTLIDVGNAIDYLVALKSTPNLTHDSPIHALDLKQVYVMGHSSGGHLATWAATRPQFHQHEPGANPNPHINIAGVIPLAGVFDLPRALRQGHDRYLRNFFGGSPDNPMLMGRYRMSSPINYLPMTTKVLAFHGDQDGVVNIDQSISYVAKARSTGTDARLFVFPGIGHSQVVQIKSPTWKYMIEKIVDFIPGSVLRKQ